MTVDYCDVTSPCCKDLFDADYTASCDISYTSIVQDDVTLLSTFCMYRIFFVRGHFQEIGLATLPFGLKPRHVEKFRVFRLTDVAESELEEEEI